MTLRNFKLSEFDSPDDPGSGVHMNPVFLSMLDDARDKAGIPFQIHSGYRTLAHNASVGGVGDSAHTKGLASDVQASTGIDKYKIVSAAMQCGFQRIGIGKTFVHLDNDLSLPNPVIWLYP